MRYNSITKPSEHIHGILIRMLNPHIDERGSLTEVLRIDWTEIINTTNAGFAQCYYSVTKPGIARDEDKWHVHQHQKDRFVIVEGIAVLALYDPRPSSPTQGRLNLFKLYGSKWLDEQCIILIPEQVFHCFLVVGGSECILLNFPTQLYDSSDEGRITFDQAKVIFEDKTRFSWKVVREFEKQWFFS